MVPENLSRSSDLVGKISELSSCYSRTPETEHIIRESGTARYLGGLKNDRLRREVKS